jgi:mRNA interferase MazF
MTTHIKDYPFEVLIEAKLPSVVLADHSKSLDWARRKATFKGKVPTPVMGEVKKKSSRSSAVHNFWR